MDTQVPANIEVEKLRRRLLSPLQLRLFFLLKLPLALFAGLRVKDLRRDRCLVTVPYSWRTQNPFRSTYFAAQSMAAELSTGLLAELSVRSAPDSVAMLIVGLEASFEKKAVAEATFTCKDGDRLSAAVAETCADGKPAQATVESVGCLPDGTVVSRFRLTWSFKRRDAMPKGPA